MSSAACYALSPLGLLLWAAPSPLQQHARTVSMLRSCRAQRRDVHVHGARATGRVQMHAAGALSSAAPCMWRRRAHWRTDGNGAVAGGMLGSHWQEPCCRPLHREPPDPCPATFFPALSSPQVDIYSMGVLLHEICSGAASSSGRWAACCACRALHRRCTLCMLPHPALREGTAALPPSLSTDMRSLAWPARPGPAGMHPLRGLMLPLSVPEDCPQEVADLVADCMLGDPAERPSARKLVERLSAAARIPAPPAAERRG